MTTTAATAAATSNAPTITAPSPWVSSPLPQQIAPQSLLQAALSTAATAASVVPGDVAATADTTTATITSVGGSPYSFIDWMQSVLYLTQLRDYQMRLQKEHPIPPPPPALLTQPLQVVNESTTPIQPPKAREHPELNQTPVPLAPPLPFFGPPVANRVVPTMTSPLLFTPRPQPPLPLVVDLPPIQQAPNDSLESPLLRQASPPLPSSSKIATPKSTPRATVPRDSTKPTTPTEEAAGPVGAALTATSTGVVSIDGNSTKTGVIRLDDAASSSLEPLSKVLQKRPNDLANGANYMDGDTNGIGLECVTPVGDEVATPTTAVTAVAASGASGAHRMTTRTTAHKPLGLVQQVATIRFQRDKNDANQTCHKPIRRGRPPKNGNLPMTTTKAKPSIGAKTTPPVRAKTTPRTLKPQKDNSRGNDNVSASHDAWMESSSDDDDSDSESSYASSIATITTADIRSRVASSRARARAASATSRSNGRHGAIAAANGQPGLTTRIPWHDLMIPAPEIAVVAATPQPTLAMEVVVPTAALATSPSHPPTVEPNLSPTPTLNQHPPVSAATVPTARVSKRVAAAAAAAANATTMTAIVSPLPASTRRVTDDSVVARNAFVGQGRKVNKHVSQPHINSSTVHSTKAAATIAVTLDSNANGPNHNTSWVHRPVVPLPLPLNHRQAAVAAAAAAAVAASVQNNGGTGPFTAKRKTAAMVQHAKTTITAAETATTATTASATSALLQKARSKKPKDYPKKPLTAYNIFFREERERILNEQQRAVAEQEGITDQDVDASVPPPKKRRRTKKAESSTDDAAAGNSELTGINKGKICFESLAKMVAQRWHKRTKEQSKYYRQMAFADELRYRTDMRAYIAKLGQATASDGSTAGAASADTTPTTTNIVIDDGYAVKQPSVAAAKKEAALSSILTESQGFVAAAPAANPAATEQAGSSASTTKTTSSSNTTKGTSSLAETAASALMIMAASSCKPTLPTPTIDSRGAALGTSITASPERNDEFVIHRPTKKCKV